MNKETRSRFGSAFDKFLDDPEFKKDYDKEFKEFAYQSFCWHSWKMMAKA